MNAALQILFTVLLVAGGIGGYHVMTEDQGTDDAAPPSLMAMRELQDIDARLARLESQEPMLQGNVTPQDLYDQIRSLRERLDAVERAEPTRTTVIADSTRPAHESAPVGDRARPMLEDGPSPLTAAEEKRVRDLVDSQMRSLQRGRDSGRLDRTLQSLGIELDDDQKTKLSQAMNERRKAIGELWRSVRDSGQSRDEMRAQMQEQMAGMNQAFTQKLVEFIPAADAESLSTSLTSGGGRGDRGGGRGGPR